MVRRCWFPTQASARTDLASSRASRPSPSPSPNPNPNPNQGEPHDVQRAGRGALVNGRLKERVPLGHGHERRPDARGLPLLPHIRRRWDAHERLHRERRDVRARAGAHVPPNATSTIAFTAASRAWPLRSTICVITAAAAALIVADAAAALVVADATAALVVADAAATLVVADAAAAR
eukprot:scaffold15214_cov63-Phaeocystis_antarctica.AAC.1